MKELKSNKLIQVSLLIVVVGIWSFAGYRFLKSNEEPVVEIAEPIVKKEATKKIKDNYTLMLNYRDPFLNNIPEAIEDIEIIEEADAAPAPPPLPVIWPNVEYHGQLKNKQNKNIIALVSINGKQLLLKKGDRINGIKIDRLYLDSCRFSFSGEFKTIIAN